MYITLSLHTDIEPEIVDLILAGKLEEGFSIDFALNALISFVNGKEIVIFDFNKYFKLDNRWSTYKIEEYGTKLVIILK